MPAEDRAHTEIVPQDVLQAVAFSAKSQDRGQVSWVSALTWDHTVLPTEPFRSEESTGPRIDLKHAKAVCRVSDFMQRGQRPPATGRKRELGETQLLLHEWDKLSLDEDGILRRCKGTRTQVIVPRQLRSRILKELHENMGQLGVERTLDLARERYY